MADNHKNFSYSTVLTAPSPATSGTSLVLTSGGGALMPSVPFNATIWPSGSSPLSSNAEIVRVTAISTDTLTITRSQESSSARTIVVGDQIAATITTKTLTDIENSLLQVYNVRGPSYGATGNGSTDDGAAIQSAIDAANAAGGGTVFFPTGSYKVTSSSRTDTVSFSSGSTFNDTSAVSGDVGKYVLWSNLGRVAKITSVVAGVSFTVDVAPLTTTATTARIVKPGLVIPEGVSLIGVGSNYNSQLTTAGAIGNVSTQITDAGTGVTILIRGANSPAGGSTRYGISRLSVLGNTTNMFGLFVGNGAWMIDSDDAEFSNHAIGGIGLDGNINSHNFHNTVLYSNGTATATTATGGVIIHPYNAAGSASCNFYNTFFSANIGFGICDGVDTGGAYGVNLWAPQFNSQQVSAMTNSGTSMVLQSKGTGDGMATVLGGWSETAALYDVITSGYVTIIGMRMHSSHAYHWIVNGGVANAVGCTFEGATTATAQLNSSGIFNWNGIKVTTDPVLYSGAPSTIPASGSSSTFFANSLTGNGIVNTGDFTVKDAVTPTKAMRFQTSAASLDVAFGGATNYISNWTGADFTGTQKFYMAFDTSGNFDAFQVWRWHTAPFGTTMMTVDSGNTTTPLQIHGGLSMDGSTSGTTALVPAAAASGTLTLPAATDTLVGRASTDTMTNKTLTNPTINGGTFNNIGGKSSITADTASISTTETVIATATIPTATVGATYRIIMYGNCTSSVANVSTWTLRAGTAGTTADAAVATIGLTAAASGTSNAFSVEMFYTLRSTGTTGNGVGFIRMINNGTTGISSAQAGTIALAPTATFNTTTSTKLSVSYKTVATTTASTFFITAIEIVKP